MLSRWLRWLVVTPVVLFVFGAILLSCSGGSSGGGPLPTKSPGFELQSITISTGAPPSPTFTPTATASRGQKTPTPTSTPKKPTPTLTPRPAATSTTIEPGSVPTGGTVAFNAIGTFTKKTATKFIDITAGPFTLWTSSNNAVLQAPLSGPMGGVYTTNLAGCACILASSGGVSSQFVGVGVYVDVDTCPLCAPLPPTPTATATSTPAPGEKPAASSTPAVSTRSAGVLMWTFDPGSELRGRIAVGSDGSIFFITRDGVLHGLDSTGKEIMHRDADGSSPAVLPDGTVVAMGSASALAAIGPDGAPLWNLEIGNSAGPLAVTDHTIYASTGADLESINTTGSLNWRVNLGPVTSAAATSDGVVVGTSRGAVTALASDGAVIWTFQPDGGFSGSVAYSDDVVYAGSASGGVYAIDMRTGSPIWHVNSNRAVTTGPVVAPSGAIFAGADSTYGVTADGQVHWTDSSLKPGEAGLTVLGYDGMFEAATDDMGAVLTGDGSYVWTARSFGKITTAASSPSGMLYVGTSTGRIFAVR
ncbi:PQQ-binding-like beta-propeller repeat protein [Candidatus Binatus sp.]|uniref:outer membrane protein assembly factor BamB family protein n=1 Tax=Candidatus Binatus sp. TaxID=2811406 RepID=UPI003C83FD34